MWINDFVMVSTQTEGISVFEKNYQIDQISRVCPKLLNLLHPEFFFS